jgi:hypothetical protein
LTENICFLQKLPKSALPNLLTDGDELINNCLFLNRITGEASLGGKVVADSDKFGDLETSGVVNKVGQVGEVKMFVLHVALCPSTDSQAD